MPPNRVAASIRLPYPPYLRKVIRHSVVIWMLVRSAYAVVLVWAELYGLLPPGAGMDEALHPAWAARALLVAGAALLVWWDRQRAHELLLPANLGVWPGWFWTASLLTALVLDVAVQSVLAAL